MTSYCIKTNCYLRDTRVETQLTECLACGNPLRNQADLLDDLFDRGTIRDIFGGGKR